MTFCGRFSRLFGALTLTAGLLLYCVVRLSPPSSPAPYQGRALLGPLVPTKVGPPRRWITINAGVIESVSSDRSPFSEGKALLDGFGAGLYATPGLIDSHVHLPPSFFPGQLDFVLLRFLEFGVTKVRELGSPFVDIENLQREIGLGARAGPRVESCGLPLTGPDFDFFFLDSVRTEIELEAAVRHRAELNLSCFKVYRGFPSELLPAARRLADRFRMGVVGHLPSNSPWDATEIDDIQHVCDPRCSRLTPSAIEALALTGRMNRIVHTPTLVTFNNMTVNRSVSERAMLGDHGVPESWRQIAWNPELLAALGFPGFLDKRSLTASNTMVRRATQRLIEEGIPILVGTDTPFPGVIPGLSVHEEMHLLYALGLSIESIWRAATSDPSSFASMAPAMWIEAGAPADLLLFREDPTRDLDALSTLEFVISAGRVFHVNDLHRLVEMQLSYLNGPVYSRGINPLLEFTLFQFASH